MHYLFQKYQLISERAEWLAGEWFVPLGARFTFVAVLLGYYWSSAMTKFSKGFFGFLSPTLGAHYQILPGITEAAGYDLEMIHPIFTLIVLLGSWAEVILPLLILIGLFTRGAALAMMGFVVVQSLVDICGHDVEAGAWFDRASDAVIMDQRLFWVFILAILVIKGAGPLSVDRAFSIDD